MDRERAQCCCRFPYATELACFGPVVATRLAAQVTRMPTLLALVDCWGYFLPVISWCAVGARFPALVTAPFWFSIRSGGELLLQALEGGWFCKLLMEGRPCRMVLLHQAELLCVFYGTAGLIDAAAAVLGDQEEGARSSGDQAAQSCQGCLLWHTEQQGGHGLSIDISSRLSTGQRCGWRSSQHANNDARRIRRGQGGQSRTASSRIWVVDGGWFV